MRVRFIKVTDTHPLRLLVLRPGGSQEDVEFANDRLAGAFHLGVFVSIETVCVASFYPEKNDTLRGWKQYRLRGMATHPDHRSRGAGEKLMRFAMDHLHAQNADLLWCNARIKAVPFYERLGLTVVGDAFEIPGIGTHYLMQRRIP
ncbi:MAG: GNAT family N-acetyltransferase [Flavobacteriales bacterium]|nr:GNAT family N-acetyltransferase [Flavobacteriales bacterium]MCC6939640.1 GNAT family N-acetyltransferase [Flavobacteriales bacterium]